MDEPHAGARGASRDAISRLFAAALDGDDRAETALHLLAGLDDTARRASWALLRADQKCAQPTPPWVLASIDRTLATLRHLQRQS
ncbi:hypothetical protein [Actinomycetospora succinea]|uniref:hypothetical protein n=1 Tax=Actinomycetospora succinea TaxID=663603 RepID=UPI001AAC6CED|nr:hypothetical protein [Actinomycetospora succinea]